MLRIAGSGQHLVGGLGQILQGVDQRAVKVERLRFDTTWKYLPI